MYPNSYIGRNNIFYQYVTWIICKRGVGLSLITMLLLIFFLRQSKIDLINKKINN